MKKVAGVLLVALGLAQMVGDLAGVPALKGVAAATCAAPAPKVFSSVRGLETYSTRFILEWDEPGGRAGELEITPELYARLPGPYNRRNVYGAALAYGPVLASDARTRGLFDAISQNTLCGDAPLLSELGLLTGEIEAVSVEVTPRAGLPVPDLPLHWTVTCC